MHYVYHYQIDNLIPNKEQALKALTKIVDATGLFEVDRHFVVYEVDGRPDIEGVTAIAFLAESHVAITTYPEHDTAFIDIASCIEFDVDELDEKLRERGFLVADQA